MMSHYSFGWDPRKDAANRKKHDVSFQEAKTAFTDEFNQRVNLTGKSYAPIVATLSPSSYPYR